MVDSVERRKLWIYLRQSGDATSNHRKNNFQPTFL